MSEFLQDYVQTKTWADMEKAIKTHIKRTEARDLVEALDMVEEYTGLDMRQYWFKNLLNSMLANKQF